MVGYKKKHWGHKASYNAQDPYEILKEILNGFYNKE